MSIDVPAHTSNDPGVRVDIAAPRTNGPGRPSWLSGREEGQWAPRCAKEPMTRVTQSRDAGASATSHGRGPASRDHRSQSCNGKCGDRLPTNICATARLG